MEALLASMLRKYFELFLKDFDAKKDFRFNLTKGEATVTNLNVNEEVIRELIGVETLLIKRLHVSNCHLNITPSKLTSVPIVVTIDTIDVVLEESPVPVPLTHSLDKLLGKR